MINQPPVVACCCPVSNNWKIDGGFYGNCEPYLIFSNHNEGLHHELRSKLGRDAAAKSCLSLTAGIEALPHCDDVSIMNMPCTLILPGQHERARVPHALQ